MLCSKCNQPLTNTRLLGGCNAKLRTFLHNSIFKFLHYLLEKHNEGRWPIVSMHLENKTAKDFKTQTRFEMTTPQTNPTLHALIKATHERLQNDKTTTTWHPTIIPTNLLLKHKRPQRHIPDIIRAIGYIRNSQGHRVDDTSYKGRRCLQLIECKYSADCNTLYTINYIHNIYEPLK